MHALAAARSTSSTITFSPKALTKRPMRPVITSWGGSRGHGLDEVFPLIARAEQTVEAQHR
jgi:hypothetical protein